jgi:hypothetical protein
MVYVIVTMSFFALGVMVGIADTNPAPLSLSLGLMLAGIFSGPIIKGLNSICVFMSRRFPRPPNDGPPNDGPPNDGPPNDGATRV